MVGGRVSCCLNLPLVLVDSISAQSLSPILNKNSHISWRRRRTEDVTEPLKNKSSLVLGVAATVVIGAIHISDVASVEAAVVESVVKEVAVSATQPPRWSDRMCPPWLQNSHETIVPENLPRPPTHRRLKLAGLAKVDAPPVGSVVVAPANKAACFSM